MCVLSCHHFCWYMFPKVSGVVDKKGWMLALFNHDDPTNERNPANVIQCGAPERCKFVYKPHYLYIYIDIS